MEEEWNKLTLDEKKKQRRIYYNDILQGNRSTEPVKMKDLSPLYKLIYDPLKQNIKPKDSEMFNIDAMEYYYYQKFRASRI